MKYYKLEHNWNRVKEIGEYPQLDKKIKLGDYESIELMAERSSIEVDWVLPELGLNHKAKQTTLLSSCISTLFFLVFKDYFIDFLRDFDLGEHQIWPMKVHHKKEVLNEYLLFHISYPSDGKYVDFANSEFLIGKQAIYEDQAIGKPVKIKDYQEYLNLYEVIREEDESLYIQCPKLMLDFENATEDMIRFAEPPQAGYYVSERLKNAIMEKRFTGMDFLEIEEYSSRLVLKNTNHNN